MTTTTASKTHAPHPLPHGLLGRLAASPADLPGLPDLPDQKTLLGLLSAWHRRGVQAGFPELTVGRP